MTSGPSLGALSAQAARKFATRECLVYAGRRWTYAQVQDTVDALAASLGAQLEPGARVGLFMANQPAYLFLQLALERAGLVRVPVNARYTAHEVGAILQDCEARALFFDEATAQRAETAVRKVPELWCCQVDRDEAVNGPEWSRLHDAPGSLRNQGAVDADDICSINYTSGTSGNPKGVVLTHRNWAATYRNMLIDRDIRGDDVLAHVGPLTHASGAYFLAWFLRGACNVIVEGGSVDALLQAIVRERVSVFTCVPTVLTRVVNHPSIDQIDLGSLRAIGYGGEPIALGTLERALRRFGPILTQNYGLTEAMMTVTLLQPQEHVLSDSGALRAGSIGRPYSFVDVKLRTNDGSVATPGEVGELTIRSEHVMQGYWRRPQETTQVLRDGWLWSGDLGTCDAQGFITLVGRSKEMLISGGFNIYPQEVEAFITRCPQVQEAAVVGVPDTEWGEIAVAFVSSTPHAPLDVAQLRADCKLVLGFRTPKIFHLVEQVPRNANGKVDKRALKEMALNRHRSRSGE